VKKGEVGGFDVENEELPESRALLIEVKKINKIQKRVGRKKPRGDKAG